MREDIFAFDLETTSADPSTARIVQIAFKTSEIEKCITLNPDEPISPGASAVHGFTNDNTKDCPKFKQIAKSLIRHAAGKIWLGYNAKKFDVPILLREFAMEGAIAPNVAGIFDPYLVFTHFEGAPRQKGMRTLQAAHKFYCGTNFEGAHDALADITATLAVYEQQLIRYGIGDEILLKISRKMDLAIDHGGFFRFDVSGVPRMVKGKYAGTALMDIPPSYFSWMCGTSLGESTRKVAQDALYGIFPVMRN